MRLLLSGVCWEHFEFPFSTCDCGCWAATSRSSTLLFSSSPFRLSYLHTPAAAVTHSLPVPRPPAHTSSIGFLAVRLWASPSFEPSTLQSFALFCFFLFSRFSDSIVYCVLNASHEQHGLLRDFHRAEQPRAGMAG